MNGCQTVVRVASIVAGALALVLSVAGCSTVETRRSTITIPTYDWGPEDVQPRFAPHIYPYPMQDRIGGEKADRTYDTLELENEYLRVIVIPELGGRVWSVLDKCTGREVFYRNQVVKPALIGLRGAWISGGIEFNTGPWGHTVTVMSPLSCRFVQHADGSQSIAIGTVEEVRRIQWTALVTLRPGRRFLEERIRLYNPTPHRHTYYFWNNVAMPNTDGTRFIYPTRLVSDHGGKVFHRWPRHDERDMTRLTTYKAPTSVFAYRCDQDFFGMYDDDIDFGVAAIGDHLQLPGKKGWTWGRGGDGIDAQSRLTDDGTWYNEIQSGPLPTQNDIGAFPPHRTIEWTEWWYPVSDTEGFEYATKDVAVNVLPHVPYGSEAKGPPRAIVISPTAVFVDAECRVRRDGRILGAARVDLHPGGPTRVELASIVDGPIDTPLRVEVVHDGRTLASFEHPLPLPEREPPAVESIAEDSLEGLWRAGVEHVRRGRLGKAREKLGAALEQQREFVPALRELALLELRAGRYDEAVEFAERALRIDPDDGRLHHVVAEAAFQERDDVLALEAAWRASRSAEASSVALHLVGAVYARRGDWAEAVRAFERAIRADSEDLASWNALARVLMRAGRADDAFQTLEEVLARDPLDPHAAAAAVQWHAEGRFTATSVQAGVILEMKLRLLFEPQTVLECAAFLIRLGLAGDALAVLDSTVGAGGMATPITLYYTEWCERQLGLAVEDRQLQAAQALQLDYVFPSRTETAVVLRDALRHDPDDGRAWYLLGNLLYARFDRERAREAWDHAVAAGLRYSALFRNRALLRREVDGDDEGAVTELRKAHASDSRDQTVILELGRLLRELDRWDEAATVLARGLDDPHPRSDLAEELVRAYAHVGRFEDAARTLDALRFNVWEGQQSVHEIYETVHRKLGGAALERGDAATAVREFRRSLEYPENLGSGKPDGRSQAHGLYLLGTAHEAAGDADAAHEAWRRAAGDGNRGGEWAKKARERLGAEDGTE